MTATASARTLVWASAAVGLAARLVFAFHDDGIHWPDEIYQSLEPAHRLVFGYGWQAWELLEGARHPTLIRLVAGLFRLAVALGLTRPEQYLGLTRGFFCVASAAMGPAVFSLAHRLGAKPLDAAVGAAVSSFMGLAVYFAPRAMGETASALPLVLGLALALPLESGARSRLAGWLLLGLAVFLRLQNALFCLGALGVYASRRHWAELARAVAVFSCLGLIYGLADALAWGDFLHSFKVYVRYNLLEGRSADFGREQPWHYLRALVTSEGWLLVPLAALGAVGWRRGRPLWGPWLLFFLVHSALPHKELRFIFVLLPLLAALGAVGLSEVRDRFPCWHRASLASLAALTVLSLALLPTLTFGRLGVRNPGPPSLSALDYGGAENRLLLKAGRLEGVCGLRILSIEHWRTGGYTYFHRPVPLYGLDQRGGSDASYSHVIARAGTVPGAVVAEEGGVALVKLAREGCQPDPGYDWHLE